MPTTRLASVFADPPVYAAGRGARPYAIPGAAVREGYEPRETRFLSPALCFFGGAAAGVLVAVAFVRAVMR